MTACFIRITIEGSRYQVFKLEPAIELDGIEQYYPGHFGSFSAEVVRAYLACSLKQLPCSSQRTH
jgi:hypothetical protein